MKIIKPLSNTRVRDALKYGENLNELNKLTTDLNFSIDRNYTLLNIYLLTSKYLTEYNFFVFHQNTCVAVIEFEKANYLKKIWGIKHKNLLISHATVREEYRGIGFAKFFYIFALKVGFTLISDRQTVAAQSFWFSLVNTKSIKLTHHCIVTGNSLVKQNKYSVKLMYM